MIPVDSSIDDELPLFSINLNGKKRSQRYEHDTHSRKKTIGVAHLSRKTQRPVLGSEDHRIRASRSQTLRYQALGEVTSPRVLGRTATKMTNGTRLRRNEGCLVACRL